MREQVKLLDFYDVEARYPNAMEGVIPAEFYSDRDAEQAIAMARLIIEVVQARMSQESGPQG
jgi:HEPN domain-containing protein